MLENGMELTLEIKRLGINGEGIAYYKKLAIFIVNALPSELVRVKIINVEPKYATGELVEILRKSPDRIEAFCPHYKSCGGCNLQHLNYQKSGKYKKDLVIEALSRYTSINPRSFEIKDTILMDNSLGYRAKSSLPIRTYENKTTFGIFKTNTNILVPIEQCQIQNEEINIINNKVLQLTIKHNIPCYNPKLDTGIINTVVTRISLATKEVQITFILQKDFDLAPLANDLLKIKNIVSVCKSINPKAEKGIFGDNVVKIAGQDVIEEKIGTFTYKLLPASFFQLNPIQTEKLYNEVKKACKLSFKEIVCDAYCGVGTIGIFLSKNAKEVIGIESNKSSIENAIENAKTNKIKNISFIEGDATKELPKLFNNNKKIDIMVFDPPRTGLTKEIKDIVLKYLPTRIVYVSCNPSTLAKDLNDLLEKYQIKYIQPIDMFPYTAHVECVCSLSLK